MALIQVETPAANPRLDVRAVARQDAYNFSRSGRMSDILEARAEPAPSVLNAAHAVYALHALSLVIGVVTAATIIGAFVFGVPSIIAVVINYLKRADARGTFVESHFRWQIRTFWFALLWFLLAAVLFATFIGIPLAFAVFIGAGVWVIYRIVRGWLALRDRRPMYP